MLQAQDVRIDSDLGYFWLIKAIGLWQANPSFHSKRHQGDRRLVVVLKLECFYRRYSLSLNLYINNGNYERKVG